RLKRVSEVGMVDALGGHSRRLERRDAAEDPEVGGGEVLQASAERAEAGPLPRKDDDVARLALGCHGLPDLRVVESALVGRAVSYPRTRPRFTSAGAGAPARLTSAWPAEILHPPRRRSTIQSPTPDVERSPPRSGVVRPSRMEST